MNKYLEKIAASYGVSTGKNHKTYLSESENKKYRKEYEKKPRNLAATGNAIVDSLAGSAVGEYAGSKLGPRGAVLGGTVGTLAGVAHGWRTSKAKTRRMALEKATSGKQD